jgi:hypothetical protein
MRSAGVIFLAAAALLPQVAHDVAQAEGGAFVTRMTGYASDGAPRFARFYCRSDGRCVRVHRMARYARQHQGTRVYNYLRRDEELAGCRETRRVVGDQHLTVDGAKKSANDAWAGAVRFHLGEKFMDLSYARYITYTCSRSSIKEGGVTTLGQTLTRCEIEAQPCAAPREQEGEKR